MIEPAPERGQHTEAVLLELDLSWEEMAEHKKSGAILVPAMQRRRSATR